MRISLQLKFAILAPKMARQKIANGRAAKNMEGSFLGKSDTALPFPMVSE
ncbi:MAG: hypothetical protein GY820_19725 [Gammaproteobacteria bacterium]|nr:hypothetical protein [Gammaproteobacteria bacterium]